MKCKALLSIATFLCLGALLLGASQALLVPHDRAANPEAFLLHDYMQADVAADEVVFLGDCEVYETFSPVTLWQEYGIESRVVGSPQQLLWHSWAVLSEVLERSRPRVVVLSVYGLVYNEPQSEAYNRMAMDALPLSAAKWEAVRAGMTEGERALSYAFPLLRYHDRWSQLSWRDVTTLFETPPTVTSRGYLVQTEVVSAATRYPDHAGALPPDASAFGEQALYWFDRIVTLCRERGVELVLVKAPTDSWRYPWHEQYEEQTVALAEHYGLTYDNLLSHVEEIGLDMTADSYDGGLHLNVWGAEKTSAYFGRCLTERFALQDTRHSKARVAVWQSETEAYERMKKGDQP